MLFGKTASNQPSRFVREIPPQYVEQTGLEPFSPARREYSFEEGPQTQPEIRPVRREARKAPVKRPAYSAPPSGGPSPASLFQKGDMVEHRAFGRGMVTLVQPMGGDALLEVACDGTGPKRLMAKAAAQQMKKL
jgi:DNA helicase-2/ATP-dependent DNA helicase PcrA